MKYRLIKQKALFQIFLIISLSFYSSLSFSALNQPLDNNGNKITYSDLIKQDLFPSAYAASKVCCELTKKDSQFGGQSCVFTQLSDCDLSQKSDGTNYKTSSFACGQTDFCAPGVCKLKGTCQDNVEKGLCLQRGGTWNKGKIASDPQCKIGCCDLPSGASLTTQTQCAEEIKRFPDIVLSDVFKPSITDQTQCLQQSRSSEEGCCVINDENQCKFQTRKECNELGGEFNLNELCSKPGLNCQVTAKHSTTCYQNKVYWTDSSGNRENVYDGKFDSSWEDTNWLSINPNSIAKLNPQDLNEIAESGNCQFSLGTTCGQVSNEVREYLTNAKKLQPNDVNKIKNQCISLNCANTIKNPNIPWMDGRTRQNGESWCEYQTKTGNGEDLVGSRHFIHVCDNGIERIEPCFERRKEICVQNDVPKGLIDPTLNKDLTYAKCVPNNWQLCLAANEDDENCGISLSNAASQYNLLYSISSGLPFGLVLDMGPCKELAKTEETKDQHNSCVMKTICRKRTCEEQVLGNCYFNKDVGLCAPSVPPGTLGKEEDYKELNNNNKIGFSFDAKMFLAEDEDLGSNPEFKEDCAAGCDSDTSNFANQWNSYCKSLGDLGAKYNVAGKYSKLGFWHGGPFNQNGDIDFEEDAEAEGITLIHNFKYYTSNIKPLSGNLYSLLSSLENLKVINYEQLKDPDFLKKFYEKYWTGVVSALGYGAVTLLNIHVLQIWLAGSQNLGFLLTFGLASSPLPVIGIILLGVVAIFYIFELLFAGEQADITYKVSCEPWVPPAKGEDCRLCNDKSKFRTCGEYLCRSLGKACTLLNGDYPGNETCVWKNEGDTIAPIIAPYILSPFKEENIIKVPPSTGFTGGYKFKNNITAFTSIDIGMRIIDDKDKNKEDFAECKISRFNNFNYDTENVQFFEDSLTKSKHIRKIAVLQSPILPGEDRIELEAGKINTFYVKCRDANDNTNIKPYFIEIPVSKGPDTSPPEIKSFSIRNNAFMPYNLASTPLNIYVEDQSGLENQITNVTNGLDGGCRYSTIKDQDYELMPYDMVCSRGRVNIDQYACTTTLNLKPNQENIFYFRCRDVNGKTNPKDSPPIQGDLTEGYHLFGTKRLKIIDSGPSGNILTTDVKLTLTTAEGAKEGKSNCYYSGGEKTVISGFGDLTFSHSGIKFTTTNSNKHETDLSLLNEKDYLFYLWCRDVDDEGREVGNEDNTTIKFHTTTPDLNITDISPDNKVIYSSKIELKVTTKGGVKENGESDCRYDGAGLTTGINDYKTTTGQETVHYKNLTLGDGTYELLVTCTDQFKSDKKKIKFEVDTTGTPKLIRLFKEGSLLNIITDRESKCHYSPTEKEFKFESGTLMVTINNLQHSLQIVNSKVFYIRCQDINTKQISQVYTVYP